jgi:hypothetical protein
MQKLPHEYVVTAVGSSEGEITLDSRGLPTLQTAPPLEFGGPGDRLITKSLKGQTHLQPFVSTRA